MEFLLASVAAVAIIFSPFWVVAIIFSPFWVFGLYWLLKHWAFVSPERKLAARWIADSLTLEPNKWNGSAREVDTAGLHIRLYEGDGHPVVNGEGWRGLSGWMVKRAMQRRAAIIAMQQLQKSLA